MPAPVRTHAWPLSRCAVLGLALLCAAPAVAEEAERDAPWSALQGRNAGAVGVCPTDEVSEHTSCYLLRCEPGRGPVFVIQDSFVTDFKLRRIKLAIGRYHETLRLDGQGPDERSVALNGHPKLLKALSSGADWANFEAENYSTGFTIEGARPLIEAQAARCPASGQASNRGG